jgi:hypothetical protein
VPHGTLLRLEEINQQLKQIAAGPERRSYVSTLRVRDTSWGASGGAAEILLDVGGHVVGSLKGLPPTYVYSGSLDSLA